MGGVVLYDIALGDCLFEDTLSLLSLMIESLLISPLDAVLKRAAYYWASRIF
jgi:hypothetical protein